MFDAAQGLNAFLKFFQLSGVAANENGFQAVMMVQMEMLGTEDRRRGVMLHMQHFVDEIGPVVVVNDADDADHFALHLQLVMYRLMADHGAQSI